jgi:hypothetical protein
LINAVRELGRYVILFHVAACVMAACAVEMLGSVSVQRRPLLPTAWIVLSLLLLAWNGMRGGDVLMSWQAACAFASSAVACAVLLVMGTGRTAATTGFAALLVTASLYASITTPKANGASDVTQAFSTNKLLIGLEGDYGRDRVLIDDSVGLPQNYADAHRLQTTLGHAATIYRPYFDFLSRDWSLHSEVDDLLNVRYVLTRAALDFPLVAVDTQSGLRLYERPTAYPRVFLTSQYGTDLPLRRAAFDLLRYDDHFQEYRIRASRREQAVVSEVAYPGWCAQVNSRPARIEHAQLGGIDTPLRAVWVEPGNNVIEFRYRPFRSLILGCD